MSSRIEGGASPNLNPQFRQPTVGGRGPAEIPSVGEQVQQALFARPKPVLLDPAQFPMLAEQMRVLNKYKKKLAQLAGDDESEYTLHLADGTIAQIDEKGNIFVGAQFLAAAKDKPELLVGVLAHEIGHRPKRWKNYRVRRELTKDDLEALCRHEETRADLFSGKALAEMDLSCDPLIEFLMRHGQGANPHPEYFPPEVRASVIRDAHTSRTYARESRKKLFPDYERFHAPKGHLGEF
jgi:hypothetical protein